MIGGLQVLAFATKSVRECTIHIHALQKPKTEIQLYLLQRLFILDSHDSYEFPNFPRDGRWWILTCKNHLYLCDKDLKNPTPTKTLWKEIEFFFNMDSPQTHFCCYKYLKSCKKKKFFWTQPNLTLKTWASSIPFSWEFTSLPPFQKRKKSSLYLYYSS